MNISKQAISKQIVLLGLCAAMSITGCSSTRGTSTTVGSRIMQSLILGAATGAVSQVNGNSKDVKNAATVGALLGILGGVAR